MHTNSHINRQYKPAIEIIWTILLVMALVFGTDSKSAYGFNFNDVINTFEKDFGRVKPTYMQERLKQIVSDLSGMEINLNIGIEYKTRGDLKNDYFSYELKRKNIPNENALDGFDYLLKQLKLLKSDYNLKKTLYASFYDEVAGFYNPATKNMVIIEGTHNQVAVNVLLHEFVHAAQDCTFDLTDYYEKHAGSFDAQLSAHSLIEGQASSIEWLLQIAQNQQNRDTKDILKDVLKEIEKGNQDFLTEDFDTLTRTRIFPYSFGAAFVIKEYAEKNKSFKEMFARVPLSTEQLLHPEKYDNYEQPVAIKSTSKINKIIAKYNLKLLFDTSLGEFFILQGFNQHMPSEANRNETAAAGWGGDHVFVIQSEGKTFLVWDSIWDSKKDAKEFFAAYVEFSKARLETEETSAHKYFDTVLVSDKNEKVYINRSGKRVSVVEGDVSKDILNRISRIL